MESFVPQHVGIIMDGNRRWAKARSLVPWEGHKAGADTALAIVLSAQELGIKYLSLFAWSTENWNRDSVEVEFAFQVMRDFFDRHFAELKANRIRIKILGETDRFPQDLQEKFDTSQTETAENTGLQLNLCVNYGGREELVLAIKKIINQGIPASEVTEQLVANSLQCAGIPDPELVIRTSGEQRTSGFLTWSTVYSELYFSPKMWPDFTKADLEEAIGEFGSRNRRFGV